MKNVVKKHGVSVKEELVVVNVVIITECQPLHWISTKGKNSNPGFRVSKDQVFRDVEDFSAHVEVDNACKSWIGCLFFFLFLIWSVKIVHWRPWLDRTVLWKGKFARLVVDAVGDAQIPFYSRKKTGAPLFQHLELGLLHGDSSWNQQRKKFCRTSGGGEISEDKKKKYSTTSPCRPNCMTPKQTIM